MDAIKELRRRKGWSQKDLSRESKVGPDTISGIESGRHDPRPSTLRKLANALGVEVADLLQEPALPKVEASPSPEPEKGSGEERRTADVGREAPADRIEVLEQGWIPPVKERVERWRTEIEVWRRQGKYPYGRADEMDAYAKDRILKRAKEIGLMDHLRAVLGGEKEVFPRELEACRVLNNELLAEAFDLVAEAYKVEDELGPERQEEKGTLFRFEDYYRLDGRRRAGRRSA